MVFLSINEARQKGRGRFWVIGFDYETDEAHTVYVSKTEFPSSVDAIRHVRDELNVEPTSLQSAAIHESGFFAKVGNNA